MKVAVSGKGGVGKTTLTAFLCTRFADQGNRVLAIDADPAANLGVALGIPGAESLPPITEMKSLIAERTGVQPGTIGGFFKLNPKVDDLPEKIALSHGNIRLMVMGGVTQGGTGCVCPENALLKSLVAHLILARGEIVIMDMAAGIEHLGRGTAQAVDRLIIVVEPGRRSIDVARKIKTLAADIGLNNLAFVGNKVRGNHDREFLLEALAGFAFLGFIPYDERIIEADLRGEFAADVTGTTRRVLEEIAKSLTS
ncbi:MAG: AAA family ATPase [Deltaproteobacteria bacterium]|nr:AAA family ATPase [Deltaproteobacteria bacterium]MBW2071270.1 AAA family ATPase [Deltaproteobacteria bacterium]